MNKPGIYAVALSAIFLASCGKDIPDRIEYNKVGTQTIDGANCNFYEITKRERESLVFSLGNLAVCTNSDGISTTVKEPDGPKGQRGDTVMQYVPK